MTLKINDARDSLSALPEFYRALAQPLQKTEARIRELLKSDNKELEAAALYLLNSGGKRLRPILLLLCGGRTLERENELISAAAAIEMVHMASLVHDDIVDKAPLRRGKPTVAASKGTVTALYTGNFLLTKALESMIEQENSQFQETALYTAMEMCRGEFLQLDAVDSPSFRMENYLLRVKRKTANLLAAACEIGAVLGGADEVTAARLRQFGENIGIAFQITDDILDYTANEVVFGKAVGSDLAEGLATMPLICAWEKGGHPRQIKELLKQSRSSLRAVTELIEVVKENDGTKAAAAVAADYVQKAKACLQDISSPLLRQELFEVADYITAREL